MPMNLNNIQDIWKKTLAQIEVKLDAPAQFKTFFSETELLEIKGKRAVIGCQNGYVVDWLRVRHEDLIKDTLSFVYGNTVNPMFQVMQFIEKREVERPNEETSPLLAMENGIMSSVMDAIQESGLNMKYALSNYIVGNPNRIAHAAAMSVLDNPGKLYNPLFIHGKTGVGKTHLAQAIGRGILERSLNKKVIYTTSENFLNDMVKSIKTGRQFKFREKYRQVDMFIIDDMQLISKWVATQDEFFNSFNEIYNAGKQVVMVADRRPEEIQNIEGRLRSRMQGGMVVDIQKPDYEMRLAILNKKAEEFGIDLSQLIVEYIGRAVTDNIRELEGALHKVSLFNRMKPAGDLTLEEVAHTLGKDAKTRREQVKVPTVLRIVSKEFGVKVKDIKGPRRLKDVALARQICMYILREEFNYKLEQIARFLNKKDHTTIIHGIDKIKNKMMIQDAFNFQIGRLIRDINDTAVINDD